MSAVATDYQKAYQANGQGGSPDWLNDIREEGFSRFETIGFPTRKDEEWKYTSVKAIQDRSFQLAAKPSELDLSRYHDFLSPDFTELVFIDGVFSESHSRVSDLPQGLTVKPLERAIAEEDAPVKSFLLDNKVGPKNPFASLNTAFVRNGAFIQLADKTVCERIIHLAYIFTGEIPDLMCFPRNVIQIGSSSQVGILESYICKEKNAAYFSNAVTEMAIGANARVDYCKIQADSMAAYHVSDTRITQASDSNLESCCLTTGGKLVRNNLAILIEGSGVHAGLDGLYTIRGDQHVDNHTEVDHQQPNSTSSQLYKGILRDKSRAVFNGKIFVRQAAQQTNAYQLNRNLLLSPDAEADTKPQLEIFADDVRCTHGATIGKLNEVELFYLQSRGIIRENAVTMMSRGFGEEVLLQIENEALRGKLSRVFGEYFLDGEGSK
jgi:Fe-S cluster assembly protein SufD